jgi:threonine aldolase
MLACPPTCRLPIGAGWTSHDETQLPQRQRSGRRARNPRGARARANDGTARSYGDDAITKRLRARFCEIFETELELFPVVTGTAANALAVAQLTPPYGAVYCHAEAHLNTTNAALPSSTAAARS